MNRNLSAVAALTAFLSVLTPWLACSGAERAAPTVRVDAGVLRGARLGSEGAYFKGIPFAAPPIGALRWADPAPVTPWSGLRDASAFAHACMQPDQRWNSEPAANDSEDCLYLNVWTPTLKTSAHRPVMVWIHGGAFVGGSGAESLFSGEHFAARGVILVTLNYRLGVFGFLAHPDLSAESSTHTSGNYGLRDQLAALRWVQLNIARFGGDPQNITIFGQSAGGGSVLDLLTSPLAAGIARQAIVESGASAGLSVMPSLAAAEQTGTHFAGNLTFAQLRELPADELLQRYGVFVRQGPQAQFAPIVDGSVLKAPPMDVFARAGEQRVALIIGNNAREGFGRMSDEELRQKIPQIYGPLAPEALKLYGLDGTAMPPTDPVFGSAGALWLTDTSFRCGAVEVALRHRATGAAVYEYQFEQSLPGREADGAAHSYELPYVFGNLMPGGLLGGDFPAADHQLSERMLDYWTDFAKRGNPNAAGSDTWPRFETGNRKYQRFATRFPGGEQVDADLRGAACELYAKSQAAH